MSTDNLFLLNRNNLTISLDNSRKSRLKRSFFKRKRPFGRRKENSDKRDMPIIQQVTRPKKDRSDNGFILSDLESIKPLFHKSTKMKLNITSTTKSSILISTEKFNRTALQLELQSKDILQNLFDHNIRGHEYSFVLY